MKIVCVCVHSLQVWILSDGKELSTMVGYAQTALHKVDDIRKLFRKFI